MRKAVDSFVLPKGQSFEGTLVPEALAAWLAVKSWEATGEHAKIINKAFLSWQKSIEEVKPK